MNLTPCRSSFSAISPSRSRSVVSPGWYCSHVRMGAGQVETAWFNVKITWPAPVSATVSTKASTGKRSTASLYGNWEPCLGCDWLVQWNIRP